MNSLASDRIWERGNVEDKKLRRRRWSRGLGVEKMRWLGIKVGLGGAIYMSFQAV